MSDLIILFGGVSLAVAILGAELLVGTVVDSSEGCVLD